MGGVGDGGKTSIGTNRPPYELPQPTPTNRYLPVNYTEVLAETQTAYNMQKEKNRQPSGLMQLGA